MKHIGKLLAALSVISLAACVKVPITTPSPPPTETAIPTSTGTPTSAPTITPTPTPATYPMRLEQVGQFGGTADTLALSGNKVYLKSGLRLVIVDISNPYEPTIVGRSDVLPGGIEAIAAMDHYALVGDFEGNLWVFDVPETGDPQVIGSMNARDQISGIVTDNQYAYLAARDADLQIVDLSEPSQPKRVGTLTAEGSAYKIAQTGHVVVIDSMFRDPDCESCLPASSTMHIVDVSNPTQPILLASRKSATFVRHISASNHLVCFGNDIFDITDPANPKAMVIGDPNYVWSDHAGDVIAGNYIFELSDRWETYTGDNSLLTIFDFSDSKAIDLVDTAIAPLPAGEIAVGDRLIVHDQLVFSINYSGLEIYDLSIHPTQELIVSFPPDIYMPDWKRIGRLPTDIAEIFIGCCASAYPGEIDIVRDYLYTFTRGEVFVWILQDPANPVLIKSLDRPRALSAGFWITGGYIRQGYYGADFYTFLDTRDPANPVITKVVPGWKEGFIETVDGNLLFFQANEGYDGAQDIDELQIFDISDPYHPQLLGGYSPIPRTRTQYRVEGTHVYIEPDDDPEQTITLDITNPFNPQKIDTPAPKLPQASNYLVQDSTVFTFEGDQLGVYNLDDPSKQLAVLAVSHKIDSWQYVNGRLVVGGYANDLGTKMITIIDITNSAHPQILGAVEVDAYNIASYKDYLYIATLRDGVVIFQLVPN